MSLPQSQVHLLKLAVEFVGTKIDDLAGCNPCVFGWHASSVTLTGVTQPN